MEEITEQEWQDHHALMKSMLSDVQKTTQQYVDALGEGAMAVAEETHVGVVSGLSPADAAKAAATDADDSVTMLKDINRNILRVEELINKL